MGNWKILVKKWTWKSQFSRKWHVLDQGWDFISIVFWFGNLWMGISSGKRIIDVGKFLVSSWIKRRIWMFHWSKSLWKHFQSKRKGMERWWKTENHSMERNSIGSKVCHMVFSKCCQSFWSFQGARSNFETRISHETHRCFFWWSRHS